MKLLKSVFLSKVKCEEIHKSQRCMRTVSLYMYKVLSFFGLKGILYYTAKALIDLEGFWRLIIM